MPYLHSSNRLNKLSKFIYTSFASTLLVSVSAIANNTNEFNSGVFESIAHQKNEPGLFIGQQEIKKGSFALEFKPDASVKSQHSQLSDCLIPTGTPKLNMPISLKPCDGSDVAKWKVFRDGNYVAQIDLRSGTPVLTLKVEAAANKVGENVVCPVYKGDALTVDVSEVFADGMMLIDAYSGKTAKVKNGQITMTPAKGSDGMLLLKPADSAQSKAEFDWQNATVYFVMTDRFNNGNPNNDENFGRYKDDGLKNIATFHGGDLVGLTQKLDYLQALGVNAIWITSPLEQMHGWVGGGNAGDFPHFGYHGYYTLDWTKLDPNMGTNDDLKRFVDDAHQRGIKVLFDVIMNHTGYNSLADMQQFKYGALYLNEDEIRAQLGDNWGDWRPKAGQNWHKFNDLINYSHKTAWNNWWGTKWIRSEIGDYDPSGFDDLTMSLASLPDIKTESKVPSGLPVFYTNKPDTAAVEIQGATPRQYLITWLTNWVRDYGIDGFRVDTAKHVEKEAWAELKQSAVAGLADWKAKNPDKRTDDLDFWMTGEAWGHGIHRSDYFDNGFDSMINFDFQTRSKEALTCYANIDPVYQSMSIKLNQPNLEKGDKAFNMLSYISSHDTGLFFKDHAEGDLAKQRRAANLLLLAPGAVQIYYGDESARPFGETGSDPMQGTRSDMNWQELETDPNKKDLLAHWQKIAQFRQANPAIGGGIHKGHSTENYYAFSRTLGDNKVMVVWAGNTAK